MFARCEAETVILLAPAAFWYASGHSFWQHFLQYVTDLSAFIGQGNDISHERQVLRIPRTPIP